MEDLKMVKSNPESTNKGEIAETPVKKISRSDLVLQSTDLITQLSNRLSGLRFVPREGDSVKLGYIRAMIQAVQVHNIILRDEELTELAQRIEKLETKIESERGVS
jgi:hypothetical protein